MTLNSLLAFISGLGGGLIVVALMVWWKKRRGEVFGDELTKRVKEQASLVGYLALFVSIAVLWVRDVSSGKGTMAAVTASPFTWLLIVGLLSWLGAMLFFGWRSGLYQGQSGGAAYTVLAVLVLFMGFLPVPWAALAQLIASVILLVGGLIWFTVRQPAR